MDKEHLRFLVKNIDTQLFDIVNNLICSICQELFNKPVTTPCGHSFCNGCIKRVLSSKDNSGCPLCKNPVKRYGLQTEEVKSTLTKICQELPAAFEMDVQELTKNLTDLEDLVKTSKLSQLYNQDVIKESRTSKQRSMSYRKTKRANPSAPTENDSGTFVPVLKRTKNVLEYVSAKKKRMDDLVSISQTEPASNSSLGDSFELDKKLEKIEKIPPEKKVNEWFNSVGDNIYINSPSSSILGMEGKNGLESEWGNEEKSTMIRRDYNKSRMVCSNNEADAIIPIDPYEFVPSQNNNIIKRKKERCSRKKISDFKALQSFSKESVKRNDILLDNSKEEVDAEEEAKESLPNKEITASQKFDELLSESKGERKKSHVLYSASQSSSTQFLDVSFHSKTGQVKKKNTPRVQKKLLDDVLFKCVEPLSEENEEKRVRCKRRRRSAENIKNGKKKKIFPEINERKSDENFQSENSVEKYLIKTHDKDEPPSTRLGLLLKELLDDDIIYATRPAKAPVRLPQLEIGPINSVSELQPTGIHQVTQMIGFCTQEEETAEERNFKQMVENMEKELNLSVCSIQNSEQIVENVKGGSSPKQKPIHESIEAEPAGNEKGSTTGEDTIKVPDSRSVEFLHLGKLTPIRKRTKTSVVKLVFPIGLTSLARRNSSQNRNVKAQISKKQTCQVSTGIQTSQNTVSAFMQTSQVPQSSVNLQTTQEAKPSIEIQTTQKWTNCAEIQTSQTLVCQEIQTTQIGYESAQVQTTLPEFSEGTILPTTPIRKPSHLHRKIINKKNSPEKSPKSPLQLDTPGENVPADKDLIMNFDVEENFVDSWRSTQKHEKLVEIKNKKNKEQNNKAAAICGNSGDPESDDSEVQPPKRRGSFRILSQDSVMEVLENYETCQMIPLDVRKINQEEEMEVVDLNTPGSQNSEEQMMRVLKNIDMDLPRGKGAVRGEKSEESDSDFFVEQTPPRPNSRTLEDVRNLSRSRSLTSPFQKQPESRESQRKENSEGPDLICDSIPKGFTESFSLFSAPQRLPLSPEKNSNTQRKTPKIEAIELPNENDQNQLNASDIKAVPRESESKAVQLKAGVDAWKRVESPVKDPPPKKICVVASSVKNPDLIKKFVSRFKIEYLTKPTKDMTHLIVGLHESEDKEVLPLCTPKLLFAMANKKWVVSEVWPETCLKMNSILPEETFETLDPVGGCGCRNSRLSTERLLKNCEVYLLGEFQMISKEEFADLIKDCGGTLVSTPEKFSFLPTKLRMIIADRDCLKLNEKQLQDLYQKYSTVVLSRDVIIMCIQSHKLVNFFPYLLHSASEERLVKLGYPKPLVRNEGEEEEEEEERSIAR